MYGLTDNELSALLTRYEEIEQAILCKARIPVIRNNDETDFR